MRGDLHNGQARGSSVFCFLMHIYIYILIKMLRLPLRCRLRSISKAQNVAAVAAVRLRVKTTLEKKTSFDDFNNCELIDGINHFSVVNHTLC